MSNKVLPTTNKIIAITLRLKIEGHDVAIISRDLNMRVKCDSFGIECYDYQPQQAVKSIDKLYDGSDDITVPDDLIDQFYNNKEVYLPDTNTKLHPNAFLVLTSDKDPKKTALARYINDHAPLRRVYTYNDIWGLSAKNKEQQFAMDLLFDQKVDIISLTGQAGTGKTLIAAACGLEQVLNTTSNQGGYDKLIITRPVQPMGRDIGFLPGTLEEKMMPWVAPIRDNLEYLFGDRTALDMHMDQGTVEIEAMTYIRGRSISNAFMIVDEAQNLTPHELKTIITRVGHGTKLVLTGDIQQIDNSYVDAVSNGLTYAVEKFKKYDISGPYPADTIFMKKNRKKFDVIIGMYHDQVLTPLKSLYEYDAINITVGLPFIRISPDHGPNETMMGKNISNPLSLIKAIKFLDKN